MLHMVCLQGVVDDVKTLIDAGADVNARADFGIVPLHRAVGASDQRAALTIVRMLLAAGADPNVTNEFGNTPLTKATERSWLDIAEEIIAAGGVG